jgi:hypothetical protein
MRSMQNDLYLIPFTKDNFHTTMDLLSHHQKNEIVNTIRSYIQKEYNIDYIPFCNEED